MATRRSPAVLSRAPVRSQGAIGALVGAGIPEERVKEYESGAKVGGIVMGVKPRTPEERRCRCPVEMSR